MKKLSLLFLFITKCFFSQNIGIPKSFSFDGNSTLNFRNSINAKILPALNNSSLITYADSIKNSCNYCDGNYYGHGIIDSSDLKQGAQYINQSIDNGKLWIYKINSSTALGLQFYFKKFRIPKKSFLFIYNSDKTAVLGPYTYLDNTDSTLQIQFGTPPIAGQTIFLEYFESDSANFSGQLKLANTIHVFRNNGLLHPEIGQSAPCEIDVKCNEGFGWEKEINSVALIAYYNPDTFLEGHCSGVLVNNTAQDGKPYFLTASHCAKPTQNIQYDYSTWQFFFNYNSINCNDLVPSNFNVVYGSQMLSIDQQNYLYGEYFAASSDFALLQLNTSSEFLKSIGACYSGWTINDPLINNTSYAVIHHPMGDLKKITKGNALSNTNSVGDDCPLAPYYNDTHYYNMHYNIGTQEPGSSGAPVYNAFHQIIGTITGARGNSNSSCDYFDRCIDTDFEKIIGKFKSHWLQGNFKSILDPLNVTTNFSGSCNSFCPYPPNTSVGIGGPVTSGNLPPRSNFSQGIKINGKAGIPNICPSDPIVVSSLVSGSYLRVHTFVKGVDCDDASNAPGFFYSGCQGKSFMFWDWDCSCHFSSYQVFIKEYNYDLTPTNNEVSKVYEQKSGSINSSASFQNIIVNPGDVGMTLTPGKFYSIGIGQIWDGWEWDFSSRLIYVAPNDLNLNNVVFSSSLYALNDVVLQNVTGTSSSFMEVVAGNKIQILPESSLKNGKYYITTLNCGSFRLTSNSGENPSPKNSAIHKPDLQFSNSNFTESKDLKYNNGVLLYPNPAVNDVMVEFTNKTFLDKDVNVTIYNAIGKTVLQQNFINDKNLVNIKCSELVNGIYLIRINVENKTYELKLIKD